MPAIVTHTHFNSTILQHARPYLMSAASADLMAFYWGGMGPDPLFFYHPWHENTVSDIGHLMHEKQVARTFRVMTRQCAAMQSASAMSYLIGFCCHYVLDKTVHPFVTYISNYYLNPQFPTLGHSALHNLCESELDRIVIEQLLHQDNAAFRSYRLYSVSRSASNAASQMLSAAAWKAYGKKVPPRAVTSSMHSMLRCHYLLSNPTGRRYDSLYSVEKFLSSDGYISSLMRPTHALPVDCTNSQHKPWIDASMPHMRRYEDFFDLLRRAEQPTLQLMDCCYDAVQTGKKLPEELFHLNYMGLESN